MKIQATQPFVKDLFKIGNVVTPLQDYIPGTNIDDYEYGLKDSMLNQPASKINNMDYSIRIDSTGTQYDWSPEMFQEFWIYALFEKSYANKIIKSLSKDEITSILKYAYANPSDCLDIIKKGGKYNKVHLTKAFMFKETREGQEYWDKICNKIYKGENLVPSKTSTIDTAPQIKESLKLPVLFDADSDKYLYFNIKLVLSTLKD